MRPAVAVACLVGGGATAVASVLVHGTWWGLALALAATAATVVALPGGWWRRLSFAVGWSVMVAVLAPERPEGDYLVAANARGYVLLGAAVAVLVSGMVGLRRPPAASSGASDASTDTSVDSGVAPSAP